MIVLVSLIVLHRERIVSLGPSLHQHSVLLADQHGTDSVLEELASLPHLGLCGCKNLGAMAGLPVTRSSTEIAKVER